MNDVVRNFLSSIRVGREILVFVKTKEGLVDKGLLRDLYDHAIQKVCIEVTVLRRFFRFEIQPATNALRDDQTVDISCIFMLHDEDVYK